LIFKRWGSKLNRLFPVPSFCSLVEPFREFAYDKDTKMTGSPKAGSKVTVKYLMKATSIDVKEEAKKAEPKKETPKKK